jgi:hypothetical protein
MKAIALAAAVGAVFVAPLAQTLIQAAEASDILR